MQLVILSQLLRRIPTASPAHPGFVCCTSQLLCSAAPSLLEGTREGLATPTLLDTFRSGGVPFLASCHSSAAHPRDDAPPQAHHPSASAASTVTSRLSHGVRASNARLRVLTRTRAADAAQRCSSGLVFDLSWARQRPLLVPASCAQHFHFQAAPRRLPQMAVLSPASVLPFCIAWLRASGAERPEPASQAKVQDVRPRSRGDEREQRERPHHTTPKEGQASSSSSSRRSSDDDDEDGHPLSLPSLSSCWLRCTSKPADARDVERSSRGGGKGMHCSCCPLMSPFTSSSGWSSHTASPSPQPTHACSTVPFTTTTSLIHHALRPYVTSSH